MCFGHLSNHIDFDLVCVSSSSNSVTRNAGVVYYRPSPSSKWDGSDEVFVPLELLPHTLRLVSNAPQQRQVPVVLRHHGHRMTSAHHKRHNIKSGATDKPRSAIKNKSRNLGAVAVGTSASGLW